MILLKWFIFPFIIYRTKGESSFGSLLNPNIYWTTYKKTEKVRLLASPWMVQQSVFMPLAAPLPAGNIGGL